MSVELLQTFSMVGYILSGILLIVTAVLFFVLKVPGLISDLTGVTARKAIENIRRQNQDSSVAYTPSMINAARGKLTDKISPSGRLQHHSSSIGLAVSTEKIGTQKLQSAVGMETTLLDNGGNMETTVLGNSGNMETIVLTDAENHQTAVMQENMHSVLKIEIDIGFWESGEIIA